MDIHRMQELMQIYDKKLDTPDYSHVFEARWAYVTSDWVRSLDMAERASVFEYIGHSLCNMFIPIRCFVNSKR